MKLSCCEPQKSQVVASFPRWTSLWSDPFVGFSEVIPRSSLQQASWHENETQYEVRLEAPGLKKEDLKLSLENDYLVLRGNKRVKSQGEEQTVAIERTIAIPEGVDTSKIQARYEDGLLDVTLPKREEVKPKEISIEIK